MPLQNRRNSYLSKKYHIHTFGCQMNVHDSEIIAGIFTDIGYKEAEGSNDADVIVLNTCSIREKAEQKFYSELGRFRKLKHHNPLLRIAVAGCIAQQQGNGLFRKFPYVDFVFGPNNIDSLKTWINNGAQNTEPPRRVTALHDNPEYHRKFLPVKREGGVRAWVSIMYGCDNFCAYCVVPYTRGRERSRHYLDIYEEVRSLADEGYKEITLLGQNVNSYGIKSNLNINFPELLEKLHKINGIERIRFVTSHPRDLSADLITKISGLSKVCEHLHLPVQSGSDRVLMLMNRGYASGEYKEKIRTLRSAVPSIAITTDIIVGFPGETEEDFQLTMDILSAVEYDGIFAFKYSKRPDTKALHLPGHIEEEVKAIRLAKVLALQEGITYQKNRRLEGQAVEILVEGKSESDPDKMTGRTGTNKIVNYYGSATDIGKILRVKIVEAKQHSLYGEKIEG